jgi:hypothetical protein
MSKKSALVLSRVAAGLLGGSILIVGAIIGHVLTGVLDDDSAPATTAAVAETEDAATPAATPAVTAAVLPGACLSIPPGNLITERRPVDWFERVVGCADPAASSRIMDNDGQCNADHWCLVFTDRGVSYQVHSGVPQVNMCFPRWLLPDESVWDYSNAWQDCDGYVHPNLTLTLDELKVAGISSMDEAVFVGARVTAVVRDKSECVGATSAREYTSFSGATHVACLVRMT